MDHPKEHVLRLPPTLEGSIRTSRTEREPGIGVGKTIAGGALEHHGYGGARACGEFSDPGGGGHHVFRLSTRAPPTFEGEAASVASACAFWGPLLVGRSALWQGLRRTHAARPFLRRRIGRGSGRARRLPAGLHRGSCGELCAAERKQTPVLCRGLAQLNAVRAAKAGAELQASVRPACACLRAGSARAPATAPALRSCSSGRGRPAAHPCRPGT